MRIASSRSISRHTSHIPEEDMAVHTTETHERIVVAPAGGLQGLRVAWGGVWSGYLVATGVFLLLTTLGLAVGVSAADVGPGESNAREIGMGAAIWTGITLLVALFVGGWVATRTGVVHDRAAGVVEGVLVWVLSILTVIYMASSGVGMLAGGVFGALGSVTRSATQAVSGMDVQGIASGDVNQILARLDDPKTAQTVAALTGTSQDEARQRISEIRGRVEAARDNPQQAAAEAKRGLQEVASKAASRVETAAAEAQPYASATMWSTLAAMVVALIAAVVGAMIGRRQVERRLTEV
jgi:hypothetical protein